MRFQFWIIGILTGLIIIFSIWSAFNVRRNFPQTNQTKGNFTCDIPEMSDPIGWMSGIVHLGLKERIECGHADNALDLPVVVEYVQPNQSREHLIKRAGFEHAKCEYMQVHYDGDNSIYEHDTWRELNESRPILLADLHNDDFAQETSLFVKVRCLVDGSTIYEDIHMFMPQLDKFKSIQNESLKKPKILVLCIESLTRINFLRSMPKAAKALDALRNVFYLKGLTRIAENTFPNMLAFLTGRIREDFEKDPMNTPLEELPHIWKLYTNRGYPTAMIDDNPYSMDSMLSYGSQGFTYPPTTFYPQPFWTYWTSKEELEYRNCLNNSKPVPKVMLSQMERFLGHCERHQLPYFAMSMLIRTTHNGWVHAQMADEFYEAFLRDNAEILNDTVVIMMGDHGDRYSEEMIDNSWGRIESMLPLMAIRLPDSLLRQYPTMGYLLQVNEKRLTTVLDVHKTLVELATLGEEQSQTHNETVYTESAYSVISEQVPLNRTCEEARIDDQYCVCDMKPFSEMDNSSLAHALATELVSQLNSNLPEDKCRPLELIDVESAIWHANSYWIDEFIQKEDIELTVRVAPSNALLRTRLSRNAVSSWDKVTAQHKIQRLNQYGNQSHCIEDANLKKYCLCYDNSVPRTVGRITVPNVALGNTTAVFNSTQALSTDGVSTQVAPNSSSTTAEPSAN